LWRHCGCGEHVRSSKDRMWPGPVRNADVDNWCCCGIVTHQGTSDLGTAKTVITHPAIDLVNTGRKKENPAGAVWFIVCVVSVHKRRRKSCRSCGATRPIEAAMFMKRIGPKTLPLEFHIWVGRPTSSVFYDECIGNDFNGTIRKPLENPKPRQKPKVRTERQSQTSLKYVVIGLLTYYSATS